MKVNDKVAVVTGGANGIGEGLCRRLALEKAKAVVVADIDLEKRFPPLSDINRTIKSLNMSAYAPSAYILPHKRTEYNAKYDIQLRGGESTFRQVDRERALTNLMRVNLLKRMESSIHSFALTVEKLFNNVSLLLLLIERKGADYDPSLNIAGHGHQILGADKRG